MLKTYRKMNIEISLALQVCRSRISKRWFVLDEKLGSSLRSCGSGGYCCEDWRARVKLLRYELPPWEDCYFFAICLILTIGGQICYQFFINFLLSRNILEIIHIKVRRNHRLKGIVVCYFLFHNWINFLHLKRATVYWGKAEQTVKYMRCSFLCEQNCLLLFRLRLCSPEGDKFMHEVYKELGQKEIADQIEAAR